MSERNTGTAKKKPLFPMKEVNAAAHREMDIDYLMESKLAIQV